MSKLSLPHNHNHNTEKILESLPNSEEFQLTSDMFRLLGDCSRIRIFWILCHCEECVINLSAMVELGRRLDYNQMWSRKDGSFI